MYPRKVENRSNGSNWVIVRNGLIKTKRIEKLTLVVTEPPHHRSPPQRIASEQQNHCSAESPTTFATKSATNGHVKLCKQNRPAEIDQIEAARRKSACPGRTRRRTFPTPNRSPCGSWHLQSHYRTDRKTDVHFSNRPFRVKHFQTVRRCSVDVAHGLALLFGIGAKALPLWDSRMRWSNLCSGLAVRRNGRSKRTCELISSVVPRGTSSTARWSSSFLLLDLIL